MTSWLPLATRVPVPAGSEIETLSAFFPPPAPTIMKFAMSGPLQSKLEPAFFQMFDPISSEW